MESEDFLIAIRAYNEAKSLPILIEKIKNLGYKNVLIVDDCSTDNTKEVIKKLKEKYPDLIYVRHIYNLNMGGALLTEFKVAKKLNKHLITLDGDLQHFPEDIKKFLIVKNYDVILGNRYLLKNKVPFYRIVLHNLNSLFNFLLSGKRINDIHNGFRAYNKKIVNLFEKNLLFFDGAYADNIAYIVGKYNLKFKEVPIKVRYTEETIKKGQKVYKTFLKILIKSFLLRFFSLKKLFILSFLGAFFLNLLFFLLFYLLESHLNFNFFLILILNFFITLALIYTSLVFWYKNILKDKKFKNVISELSIRKYLKNR
jgi:glycosyltransferase involved in cell wall biosynthesis